MKATLITILRIIPILFTIIIWSSCSQDIEMTNDASNNAQKVKVRLKVNKVDFDSQGTTRTGGSGTGWESGESIYLKFDNGSVTGIAVYNAKSNDWNVYLNGLLTHDTHGKVEAYYFDQPASATSTEVSLAATTGVYHDAEGVYNYTSSGDLDIIIALRPITSRIRFRGTPKESMSINGGITAYSSFTKNTFSLKKDSEVPISLNVGSNGYTPYVYGLFTNISSPSIKVVNGCYMFTTNCPITMFQVGESGWMNIPTKETHNGWMITGDALGLCPDANHPHPIDIGIGVKFACCNVGATTPIEYGNCYAWGETVTKSDYSWSTYKWCDGSDNGIGAVYETYLTKYCNKANYGMVDSKTQLEISDDAANANWGGTWRMPTGNELLSLLSRCSWERTTILGIEGYKVTAKNGNTIFLPETGWYSNTNYYTHDRSVYWSSSLETSHPEFGVTISFNVYGIGMDYNYGRRFLGQSVRPVTD